MSYNARNIQIPARGKVNGTYVNSSLAKSDAMLSGFDEAILLNQDGHVSEASAANFVMVRNGSFRIVSSDSISCWIFSILRSRFLTFSCCGLSCCRCCAFNCLRSFFDSRLTLFSEYPVFRVSGDSVLCAFLNIRSQAATTQSDVLHLYHEAKCNKQNILIRLSAIVVLRSRETGQDENHNGKDEMAPRIGGQNADRMNRLEIVWEPDYRNRYDFFEFRGEKPLRGMRIHNLCFSGLLLTRPMPVKQGVNLHQ